MKKVSVVLAMLGLFAMLCFAYAESNQTPAAGKKVTLGGKEVMVDDEGYLLDPTDWDENVAADIAKAEEIKLTDDHNLIIIGLRISYDDDKVIMTNKVLIKWLAREKGIDNKEATELLYALFPAGGSPQACKIAGLPKK